MKILVAGLGLIGGSICKAIHTYTDHAVYGWNRTKTVAEKAFAEHVIDGIAEEDCSAYDMMIVSLYPDLTKKWVRHHAEKCNCFRRNRSKGKFAGRNDRIMQGIRCTLFKYTPDGRKRTCRV